MKETKTQTHFNSTQELIEDIRQGKMVLLVDDEDRENEGDLVVAGELITTEQINFMAQHARGLICLALDSTQTERLNLNQMVHEEDNDSPNGTAFTVSIEAAQGVSTGISAADRAHTIRVASNVLAKPSDIRKPGHIFPIRAQRGGVLRRAGHTEGSVDLAKLAGLSAAAVICEVMNPDGSMARVPDLVEFSKQHQIKIGTIVDLIEYRLTREKLIECVLTKPWNVLWKDGWLKVYKSLVDNTEHLVLGKGDLTKAQEQTWLTRVQTDLPHASVKSIVQMGHTKIEKILEMYDKHSFGVFVSLTKPNVKNASWTDYLNPDFKLSTDSREIGIGSQILRDLNIRKINLISNSPKKKVGIKGFDIEIIDQQQVK